MIRNILGLILLISVGLIIFGKYTIIILLLILGLYLIRIGADIFWWGRDKDKW